jgi:hypothetical protein
MNNILSYSERKRQHVREMIRRGRKIEYPSREGVNNEF